MDPTAQLITAFGTLLVGVITAVFSGIAMLRASQAKASVEHVAVKVEEVHRLTNSLADKSNAASERAGQAEGELRGRDHTEAKTAAAAEPAKVTIVDPLGQPTGSVANPIAVVTPVASSGVPTNNGGSKT